MKKNYLYVIIAVLILSNIFTMSKLNRLERTVDDSIQHSGRTQEEFRREIRDIYSNVDEKLKKQASILDEFDITFGDGLSVDLTVPVSISLTPKEITENLKAELLINDKRSPMTKAGTGFTASLDANIFDPFQIKVVLINEGIERIETIDDYDGLWHKYMLDIHAYFAGDSKYSSGKYEYKGDVVIFNTFEQSNNDAEKISILTYINGEVLDEQEVEISENELISHRLESEVELTANDRIEIYVNVQDRYGINYKYIVKADEIDSEGKLANMTPEWTNGSMIEIKDKNGKVLLENKFQ